MEVDLETAARTLVVVAMGQAPGKRVTVGLIVAVLAGKFSTCPENRIAELAAQLHQAQTGEPVLQVKGDFQRGLQHADARLQDQVLAQLVAHPNIGAALCFFCVCFFFVVLTLFLWASATGRGADV